MKKNSKHSKKSKEKIRHKLIGNKNAKGNKNPGPKGQHWKLSKKTKRKMKGNKNALGNTFKLSEDHKEKIRCKLIGNKNALGYKLTDEHKEKIGKAHEILYLEPRERKKQSKRIKEFYLTYEGKVARKIISRKVKEAYKIHPELIEKSLKNGFGTKCYSDDVLFFPSLQERNCYYWIRELPEVVEVKKFGRFDFIITLRNRIKIVVEYHLCRWFFEKRSYNKYYNDRRKLLDELGYKDLKLVVMMSLFSGEKKRIKEIFKEAIL